jgi:hypothetical protein
MKISKQFILLISLVLCAPIFLRAQEVRDNSLPKVSGDTLFTTSGYPIIEGMDVKIGTGSTPDGDFKFIRRNAASAFAYYSTTGYQGLANQANALPRNSSGLKYKVLRVEKRGNSKHGYVYYCILKTGLIRYEVDVENAIASGELSIPDEYKKKEADTSSKMTTSVADELIKLKDLLDKGVITQEEFEQQKKKLLNQ